ncbi:hypothetical protein CHS0354_007307 [Potamilus streckersoni]|uniref:Sulfotransferase domain-containing protein n=1 Tax=Potamilus streckersoni TaxID=2493646 RepID=A0AAE0TDL9_9BIVA|nr:hypothetical protein CHS0354_007307 [Potamilus streckersoni]
MIRGCRVNIFCRNKRKCEFAAIIMSTGLIIVMYSILIGVHLKIDSVISFKSLRYSDFDPLDINNKSKISNFVISIKHSQLLQSLTPVKENKTIDSHVEFISNQNSSSTISWTEELKPGENMNLKEERYYGEKSDNNNYGINKGSNMGSNVTRSLPDAIIIGVKKGGTRALLEYLRLHPKVRATGPEPHFFDRNYEKGFEWYRQHMPASTKGQLTIEKTPSYFVTNGVPEKVYKMSKKTKLIIVLRDPVTRAISDYAQLASRRPSVKTFEELAFIDNRTKIVDTSWPIIKIGIYIQHLVKWLEYFPIGQIHFVSGENLIKEPTYEMKLVQEFLGLEPMINDSYFSFNNTKGFPCFKKQPNSSRFQCLNRDKGRLHPDLSHSVIKRLRDFYRPFNARIYQITGHNFGWT